MRGRNSAGGPKQTSRSNKELAEIKLMVIVSKAQVQQAQQQQQQTHPRSGWVSHRGADSDSYTAEVLGKVLGTRSGRRVESIKCLTLEQHLVTFNRAAVLSLTLAEEF